MVQFLKELFDTDRQSLKRYGTIEDQIEAMENEYEQLSDEEIKANTHQFKSRLEVGETFDDILPEGFATGRGASRRVFGLFPFRVQIMGGMALHEGKIAEMKTGEGKTLT